MKNISMKLEKPYSDKSEYKAKISFEAEFDDEMKALNFQRDLNMLVITFKEPREDLTKFLKAKE